MSCNFSSPSLQETLLKVSVNYEFLPKALWEWDLFYGMGMLILDSGGCGAKAEFSVACPSWVLL